MRRWQRRLNEKRLRKEMREIHKINRKIQFFFEIHNINRKIQFFLEIHNINRKIQEKYCQSAFITGI